MQNCINKLVKFTSWDASVNQYQLKLDKEIKSKVNINSSQHYGLNTSLSHNKDGQVV